MLQEMDSSQSPQHNCKHPNITANSPPPSQEAEEPTALSIMNLTNNSGYSNHQPPCFAATTNNPMKRPSPSSSSSSAKSCTKKLFCDQEDLTLYGFSTISIPLNINPLVNKRGSFLVPPPLRLQPLHPSGTCVRTGAIHSSKRGSRLSPLPPRFKQSMSHLSIPSPVKAMSCLSSQETFTPDFVRLGRMEERLKEMRQWLDEVMKDEEEDGREEVRVVSEDVKVLGQDDLRDGDYEELVSVDWGERFVSLAFRCPCGKDYEVLLFENNCYYRLM